MNIYIDKEFLDDFYIEYDEDNNSAAQKIVFDMFVNFPEVEIYTNYELNFDQDNHHELDKIKEDNLIFAKMFNQSSPTIVKSLKEKLFNSNFKRELVFMKNKESWFEEARKLGALCFSYDSFKEEIENVLEKHSFKIDLSVKFTSFDQLVPKLPFNQIVFSDKYVLSKIKDTEKNINTLLKEILSNKTQNKVDVKIYTSDFGTKKEYDRKRVSSVVKKWEEMIRENIKGKTAKFYIINSSDYLSPSRLLDFHDRLIIFNYQIIESGKGFNLFPYKKSNSQIISSTIFDLYTWKRIKNLSKYYNEYYEKIKDYENPNYFLYSTF